MKVSQTIKFPKPLIKWGTESLVELQNSPLLTLLLLSSSLVLGVYVNNTVSINVKGHLNLGNSPWSRGNPHKLEPPEDFIVLSHLSLSLTYYNLHGGLPISSSGEDLKKAQEMLSWV